MRFVSLVFFCCFIVAQVVGQLKPIEKYDDEYESYFQIIAVIDNEVNYKNIVTFFGDSKSTSFAPSPQQQLIQTFERTLIVAGPSTGSLREICSAQSLAMVFKTRNLNHTLDVLQRTLDGLQMDIIFLFNMPFSHSLVKYLFNWSEKNKFKKILITFYRNQQYEIWTFKSRPKFIALKINLLEFNDKFVRKYFNMEQYKSVIGFFHNLPDAFLVSLTSNIEEERRLQWEVNNITTLFILSSL